MTLHECAVLAKAISNMIGEFNDAPGPESVSIIVQIETDAKRLAKALEALDRAQARG